MDVNLLLFIISSPFLLVFLLFRVIYLVFRYQLRRGTFADLPTIPTWKMLGLTGLAKAGYVSELPLHLCKAFPAGFPPLINAGSHWNGAPIVYVCDIEALRAVTTNDIIFPSHIRDLIGNFIGYGIAASSGEHWQHQRTLINPWFHSNNMKTMAPSIINASEELICYLKIFNGGVVDVIEAIGKPMQKALVHYLFGDKIDGDWVYHAWVKINREFLRFAFGDAIVGETIGRMRMWPWNSKIHENKKAFREKVQGLIDASVKSGGNINGDFIDYMVASGCSSDIIFEEVLTLIFGAHNTVKHSIAWVIYFLSQNPAILQNLQQEVDRELQGSSPTFNNITELQQCKNAFMETLRMRPPLPVLMRVAAEDTTLSGHSIPKGTMIYCSVSILMANPKYWPAPQNFKPERFDEDPHYNNYFVPFSMGRRTCIGAKYSILAGTIFVAQLVQNFDIEICNEYPVIDKIEVTVIAKGLHCRFIERKK